MSVFNRLMETGGDESSVYSRLMGDKSISSSTVSQPKSVYDRLMDTKSVSVGGESSVYNRFFPKENEFNQKPQLPSTTIKSDVKILPEGVGKIIKDYDNYLKSIDLKKQENVIRKPSDKFITEEEYYKKFPDRSIEIPKNINQNDIVGRSIGIGIGLYNMLVAPDKQQKDFEAQIDADAEKLPPAIKTITSIQKGLLKKLSRFTNPGVRPLGEDVGNIIKSNVITSKVLSGELPKENLDNLPIDNISTKKVLGDVTQAVLTAYGPKIVTSGVGNTLLSSQIFAAANILSQDIKDPKEVVSTMQDMAIGGLILHGVMNGTIKVSGKVKAQISEGLRLYKELSPVERQAGFISFGRKGKQPEVPNLQEQTSIDTQKYIDEQINKQEMARKDGEGNKLSSLYKLAKSKIVDVASPIEDTLRLAQKKGKYSVLPEYDISNRIDRVLRSPSIATQFSKDKAFDVVIKKAPDLKTLDQYLIAKQAIDIDTRGINTGRNIAKDNQLVKELSGVYDSYAKQVTKYSQDLLDKAVEYGLVSQDNASMLKQRYPNYVPIKRIFSEIERPDFVNTNNAIASLGKQSVVQKLVGSNREIENPVYSLMEKTLDVFQQGEKNQAARLLISYEKLPGNPFGIKEIPPGQSTKKGKISFLDNGKKRTFEIDKDVANAAKLINVQKMNVLGRLLSMPVRLAKVGITGINLPFIASNVVKDQLTAAINSKDVTKTSIANPAVFFRSLLEVVNRGKLYDEMVRSGALGTSFDIARNQIEPSVARIRAGRNIKSKILYTVKHPSELLRAVEDIVSRSEEFTRIQQYLGTKMALEKKGILAEDINVQASKAARENTANFLRYGEWGQVIKSSFLYLSAGIQGSRALLRSFVERPIQTSVKIAMFVFTPMAITTAWNLSDPKRKEAYEDISDYEKENNIIIIPPNPVKNEDGSWNVIKIPLAPGLSNISGMVRRPIEQLNGLEPIAVKDISNIFIGAVSPVTPDTRSIISSFTPQIIKPSIELLANKSLYTGLPIIPASMEKLSPELQYKPYSSGTARLIGKVFKISPIKLEYAIKGVFGGIGPQAINIIDNSLAGLNIIPKDQIGGRNVVKAIVSRFAEARGGKSEQLDNTLTQMITEQADDKFLLNQEAEVLYKALKEIPKEEARLKFGELMESNPNLAKEVNNVIEDEKLGLSYADRVIKTLGVVNGSRAKYIKKELDNLKTKEEKRKLWDDYVKKKIITKQVASQLSILLNNI